MGERFQETLGQYLRRERESRRISLDELSRTTRINYPFLRALEENDFDFFSQDDFIPGFLKLYARHVGLDCQEVLQRYEFQSEMHRQKKAFQQLPLFLDFNPTLKKVTERRPLVGTRLKRRIIPAAILFIALGIFIYAHRLPEKTRDPGTSRPAFSQNIGQKDGAQETTALQPTRPAEKENLPRNTQDRPEFVDSASGNKDKIVREPDEQPIPPMRAKVKVIGNRDSKRYHLPGMKYYHKVLVYHRVEFDSERQAIRAGYHKALE
jgi:cytoskeletal protein RodZ